MMFWPVVFTTLVCMTVAGVLVFRSTRNAQVMDRRLARARVWAVAVYGEPQKRRKQEGGGLFPASGVVRSAECCLPAGPGGCGRAGQAERPGHEGGFSPSRCLVGIHDGQAGGYPGERRSAQLSDVGGTVAGGIHLNADHPAGRSGRCGSWAGFCPRCVWTGSASAGNAGWPRRCRTPWT